MVSSLVIFIRAERYRGGHPPSGEGAPVVVITDLFHLIALGDTIHVGGLHRWQW